MALRRDKYENTDRSKKGEPPVKAMSDALGIK